MAKHKKQSKTQPTEILTLNESKGSRFLRILKKQYGLLLMALPAIVLVIIFNYLPMYGILISFKDYNAAKGVFGSEWVGLKYFKLFFSNPLWFRLVKNTFLLSLYSLLWSFPAPILLALLFNELKGVWFKKITQTISYFPHFLSVVVIVGLLKEFAALDGLFNQITGIFGIEPISFFTEGKYFRTLYVASGIWQGIGWGTIIYLAAIAGVDPSLYEAATIDGANRFQKAIHITLAAILPTVTILLIMNMGSLMAVGFEKVMLMYHEGIYDVADVISTYVYREGIRNARFSYTTAVGLAQNVVSLAMVIIANTVSKKVSETSLW